MQNALNEEIYTTTRPIFQSASILPNPANINTSILISVNVTDEVIILSPEVWQNGEIYSGEV